MSFEQFIEELKKGMQQPLPGREAQMKMAPPSRKNYPDDEYPHAKPAATLSLFFPDKKDIRLLFILRQSYNGVHSGQISFPGGAWEPGDSTFEHTALRETQEETGIDVKLITILGKLTPLYVPPSNFFVHPFVGYLREHPQLFPDFNEVSEVFSLSLSRLIHENSRQLKPLQMAGKLMDVPCIFSEGRLIWGATAMILYELLELIRQTTGYFTENKESQQV